VACGGRGLKRGQKRVKHEQGGGMGEKEETSPLIHAGGKGGQGSASQVDEQRREATASVSRS